tara:strand:- start:1178 stop:2875 length:1698 start_codon:yes stop_codon:yes gene_type:complete
MSQKNSELIRILEKFPDQNPNPVLRFTYEGSLVYFNEPSIDIINEWHIGIGEKPEKNLLKLFLFKTPSQKKKPFEIKTSKKTFLLTPVYVEELKCINIYGSDITAIKAIDKFPDQNPNPVLRITNKGILTYFNKASSKIIEEFNLSKGRLINGPLLDLVGRASIKKNTINSEIEAQSRTYFIYLVPVPEFDFIIVYGSDITSAKLLNKFPDQNPNPVMRFSKNWLLEYFNNASNYIIEVWNLSINEKLSKEMINNFEKNNHKNGDGLEIKTGNKIFHFNVIEIIEFEFFLVYGTDITDAKDKEMILSKLSKYFSPQVYKSIFSGEMDVKIETNRKNLTVFFSDIKGFTTISEKLEPEKLTEFITQYLTEMTDIAITYGGTVDKYIGDAIMIFFGDPNTKGIKEDAISCVTMAIRMQEKLKVVRRKWKSLGITESLDVRMGIHTDICTVGNFGSKDRLDYTVLGNGVNLASRLENSAKPNEILISENTFEIIKESISCSFVSDLKVKGRSHAIKTYKVKEVVSEKEKTDLLDFETRGFSLIFDKEEIKNKKEIENYLKKAIDLLKS